MKLSLSFLCLGAALFGACDVASASTFQYGSYSVTNEQDISISTPNNVSGGAGQIKLIGTGPNATQTILAWCMDIYDFLQNSGTYSMTPLTTAGTGGSNPGLSSAQIGQIGALITHGDGLINTATDVSAAIQLAIWEVEYGKAFSSNGISTSVSALAATYVTDVQNGTWAPNANVELLSQSGNQTLAYVTPLPSTWTLMLAGLAGLGFFAHRRTKRGADMVAA